MNAAANLHCRSPAFHTPSGAPRHLPRLRGEGGANSRFAKRRAYPLNNDRQPADDEIVRKSQDARSSASEPGARGLTESRRLVHLVYLLQARSLPQLAGEGGAKRRMGYGPPRRRETPCRNGGRKPPLSQSCFPHPIRRSAPPSPTSRGRGANSRFAKRRAYPLDNDRQPADDEIVRKSKTRNPARRNQASLSASLVFAFAVSCVRPSASTTIFRARQTKSAK